MSCYGTLQTLRKLKHFTDFKLRKHLAESLILSKTDYCDIVFYLIPKFLSTRLQRLQFAAACFGTDKYVNDVSTLIKLGWLPINERRDFSLLKQTFKAMYNPRWPSSLNLEVMKPARNLHSNVAPRLLVRLYRELFKTLPLQFSIPYQ